MNNLNKQMISVVFNDLTQKYKDLKSYSRRNLDKSFNDSDGALTDKSVIIR